MLPSLFFSSVRALANRDFTVPREVLSVADVATIGGQSGVLIDTGGGDSIFLVGLSLTDLSSMQVVV